MAGLIYLKTKEPTEKFEAISELTSGTFNTLNAGIAFGGPTNFSDNLSYRLALRKDYSDGFRKNLYSGKSDTSKKDESTYCCLSMENIKKGQTVATTCCGDKF